ncbi:CdaR family transcriptional regulator [Clostridium polynesiense]|uniref:CdaR family transcriptional regulator n=1 Tax=Clostridium polynesiense TaxID=1325933 RepID=UPI00058ADDE3|nr:sugar diacid recognition domain-containing protein [Clostridium polynesiense]
MISLTDKLAQTIVNKMMKVIPYNVNIMDSQGVIIGSGDISRIGKIHQGAVTAIEKKKLVAIYKDAGAAKPGVNMPIYFKEEVVGVIGISGEPDVVSPFASIVKVTAELLINQESLFIEERSREKKREEVLYQWAFLNEEYEEDFIKRAASLDIDLMLPRRAVAVSSKTSKKINLDKLRMHLTDNEYLIRINPQVILLFLKKDERLSYRTKEIYRVFGENAFVAVGTENHIMAKSVNEALKTLDIIKKVNLTPGFCSYIDIIPIDALSNIGYKEKYIKLIKALEEEGKGSDLIETLIVFIKNNGEINLISKEMHLHRNSLNYRLQKIHDITGKSPRSFKDLLELFTALILYKLNS